MPKKILVVEDNEINALQLERILKREGHEVVVTADGEEAMAQFQDHAFDAVITDWMMPNVDGIELIRRLKQEITPTPIIIMVTALGSPQARRHALEVAGADDFIAKPYDPKILLESLNHCFLKLYQPMPETSRPSATATVTPISSGVKPKQAGIFVASSTGGPVALRQVLAQLPPLTGASMFIVQHGPAWMMEAFCEMLTAETTHTVHQAQTGMMIREGHIYVAPGEKHMVVGADMKLHLNDDPPENYAKPSADPLFRSGAEVFGKYALGVVMTGLGRDGGQGAAAIVDAGGQVIIQSPDTCAAPYMPQTVTNLGVKHHMEPLATLGSKIATLVKTPAKA